MKQAETTAPMYDVKPEDPTPLPDLPDLPNAPTTEPKEHGQPDAKKLKFSYDDNQVKAEHAKVGKE